MSHESKSRRKDEWRPKICTELSQTLSEGIRICGYAPDVVKSASSLADAFRARKTSLAAKIIKNCRGSFWGWFENEDRLWIFTDRWGSYPVFRGLSKTGEEIVFSSFPEVLDLLHLSTTPFLMATYLTFGYVPGEDTLIEKTRALSPGCLIEFNPRGEIKTDYFTFLKNGRIEIDPIEVRNELGKRLLTSVKRALEGVDEILISIGGGRDSRAFLALALECLPSNRIHTFTYGFPGSFDYELSQKVARVAGVDHRLYPISIENYNVHDVSDLARDCGGQIFFLPQPPLKSFEIETRRGMPILAGFADEIQAGSHIWAEIADEKNRANWSNLVLNHHVWLSPKNALSCLSNELMPEHEFRETLLRRYFVAPFNFESLDTIGLADRWDFINRQRKYVLFCISKMRYRQNYIFPYLDPVVSEFLWALPTRERINCAAYQDVLMKSFPKLFRLPSSRSFGGTLRKNIPLKRGAKLFNAFRFWSRYNLLRGRLNPYFYVSYLPFHKYYNDTWEVIRYLKDHRTCLSMLNWKQFDKDLEIIRAKNFFADYRRQLEVSRIEAFINLGMGLLLFQKV